MVRFLSLVVAAALIPGCGLLFDLLGLSTGDRSPFGPETGSAKLRPFASEQELADYFSEQVNARNDRFAAINPLLGAPGGVAVDGMIGVSDGVLEAPLADQGGTAGEGVAPAASTDSIFSQTTIQVEGVDEPDVVKTDGTYLYVIDGGTLRIARVSPADQLALLSLLSLEGSGREIFLHNNKVIALTETGGGFFHIGGGGIAIDPLLDGDVAVGTEAESAGEVQFDRPRTIVTVIDVSTPNDPTVLSQTKFDGVQSASRMIDGVLHLVISNFQNFFFDVLPTLGEPELDASTVDVKTLLPGFERIATDGAESSGRVLTWRELYRPTDPDGFGEVTVVSLDVDADAEFTAVGIVAQPGLVFSSLTAMYLTDTEFGFFGDTRETTDIYKFAYVGRGAEPVATGTVPGRILNQYSMDEYAGHLRVATTVGPTFSIFEQREGPFNNVFVLAQQNDELEVVGSVENIAPGETIQSARFVGDRGFLVTFEQIDPLFTLDFSDPTDPRVVGELKVPGFSTFIVPIDADHLLTVGQYVPEAASFFVRGVQLSIFDVSDFANPQRTANVILGQESGASSEAIFNPKAFTYFPERGLVALPVMIFDDTGFTDIIVFQDDGAEAPIVPQGFEGLVVYSVSVAEGLTELGRISTLFDEAAHFGSSFTRGVFINEDVFAVTNRGLRGATLTDLATAPYELAFELPTSIPLQSR